MDKIDRLMRKVKPKQSIQGKLQKDNPYLGKSGTELLDYLSGDNYRAPEKESKEWAKFMYALCHASGEGGLSDGD